MTISTRWLAAVLALGGSACGVDSTVTCDGTINHGEDCDDGNLDAYDGCDCRTRATVPDVLDDGGAATPIVLVEDGAWCWYQDERVVMIDDRVVVASASHAGDLQVSSYDLGDGAREHAFLRRRFDRDDHDVASLLPTADGRVLAFYNRHEGAREMRWRSASADDLTTWSDEQTFEIADYLSYSNPFELDGRLHLFFRGLAYNTTFTTSTDGGDTWTPPGQVLDSYEYGAAGRVDHRPYVKYASDGVDTIHLLYTDGHPREFERNSVYHLAYRDGELHGSDGASVTTMRPGEQPKLAPEAGTLVYDGVDNPDGQAWVWDAAVDADGDPVVVFATFPRAGEELADHRYRYARWDGARWRSTEIAFAGTGLYGNERFYSGGIALDPDDPDVVYLAANVDPVTGAPIGTGRFELYRGVTDDDGATWTLTAVTADSTVDNLRPVVPAHHPAGIAVTWMQGTYSTYVDWNTRIVGWFADDGVMPARVEAPAPDVALARFDLGADDGATPRDGAVTASDGPVTLRVDNVDRVIDVGRGDALARDGVIREAGGEDADDKLHVRLLGLTPGTRYVVRLGAYLPVDAAPLTMLWFEAGDDELPLEDNPRFLAAHRLAGDAAVTELTLTADPGGAIELVARGLEDVAVLSSVEVRAAPATTRRATLRPDRLVEGALTVTLWADRGDAIEPDIVVGEDALVLDVDGLEPGRDYQLTVHTADPRGRAGVAARWTLEEAGAEPRVVRSMQLDAGTPGAGGAFTFHHRAREPRLRLRAQDVLHPMSTEHSVVLWTGLDVDTVDPE